MLHRAKRFVLRPGVSGRVLGTMLLPLLLLGIVSVSVTAERHQDALVAERIVTTSQELESLVALRSAMLAERLAEEVTLSGRQPPEVVSRTSEFLSKVLDHPGQVVETTDSALAAVPDDLRPFDADDLARVRADRPPAGDSTALIAARWEPLQAAVVEQMDRSLAQIRMDAVLLGDLELASATDDLDAAIAAPTRSAELLGLLTELWLSPTDGRLALQAQLAAEDARFSATTEQLERSADPSVRSPVGRPGRHARRDRRVDGGRPERGAQRPGPCNRRAEPGRPVTARGHRLGDRRRRDPEGGHERRPLDGHRCRRRGSAGRADHGPAHDGRDRCVGGCSAPLRSLDRGPGASAHRPGHQRRPR